MIEIIKKQNNNLKILKKYQKNTWINILNPDVEDISKLSKLLKIKKKDIDSFKEDIYSLQDMEEIPILKKEDNYKFIITKTPQKRINNNIEYFTVPLGVILTKNNVITICYRKNDVIEKLKTKKIKTTNNQTQLFLDLLLLSSRIYLQHLKEISIKLIRIENKLEQTQKNKEITSLLDLKKSLVYFNTSLKNDEILLERIYKTKEFINNEENEELIEDVIDENKQAIEMTAIYSEILKNTLEVFSSVINNNLNKAMKLLTSITIIIAIPTLITGIYGMNVSLPLEGLSYAFMIIMFMCLLLSVLSTVILWKYELL